MAAVSPQITPVTTSHSTHSVTAPPLKAIKKAFTHKRRSSEIQSEGGSTRDEHRPSVASASTEKSPSRKSVKSTESSPTRDDGSSRSGSSGIRKLLPGHSKRKRRKIREQELRKAEEDVLRGRSPLMSNESIPGINRSTSSLTHDGDNSLLTDDSEPDTAPSLLSRDSHAGYLVMSSPLITTTTFDDDNENGPGLDHANRSVAGLPSIVTPEQGPVFPNSLPGSGSTPVLPMPGLIDKADTLRPESLDRGRSGSISKSLRGKSPARRFKDVFSASKSQKSPKVSPERKAVDPFDGGVSNLLGKGGSISERRLSQFPDRHGLEPVATGADWQQQNHTTTSLPQLDIADPPRTPPGATLVTPLTTVTPPTPTGPMSPDSSGSPRRHTEAAVSTSEPSGIVISPTGMISHRRTRSNSSNTNQPSKLSSSTLPPLTPMLEEVRNASDKDGQKVQITRTTTPGGGFFSSWVSAAQTAASNLTNTINTQTRSRSGTNKSESSDGGKASEDTVREYPTAPPEENEVPKKQLAVETLGSGDLNFAHLGLEGSGDERTPLNIRPDLEELRKNSTVKRDEAAAKIEDMLAKRAVSAAYEKPTVDQTPVAEVTDPMEKLRHTGTGMSMAMLLGDQTPPNGSIFEVDGASVKRSGSMRSRMRKRRSRGSSVATGVSTIGALIGGSTATLANPASGPRLTGFAVAPKQRNRNFHQQFRSVPEDDYLIEDYSCALQKEILLAGRIYISEGHICFSSNILGWVTTLVISFDEVVSIERETTAMVFPNAIAIQTLHARHTFRSLLSREATFDLLIGIWKVSHPASFKKSVNGKQWLEQEAAKMLQLDGKVVEADEDAKSDDESEESGSLGSYEDDSEGAPSFVGSAVSMAGSEMVVDAKSVTRKPSAVNGTMVAATPATASAAAMADAAFTAAGTTTPEAQADFPGPATHAPTDCTDNSTHYEKIIKDEIISAPLGKVYSLLYGPLSGVFVKKYIQEECKCLELQFEDDKKGLNNDIKTRNYTYIKPLGGSIGPKQTKCITTENLDFFDLEHAVSVTCTTQTPDVPSGSSFSVKTRYCLSWAPGNQTRLQMNCGIEWTAKSWLKGPIEKGANDGQQQYGDGLVRVLRGAIETRKVRERGATGVSKGSKIGRKKKRRGEKGSGDIEARAADVKNEVGWGFLEPLKPVLKPISDLLGPSVSAFVVLFVFVFVWWLMAPGRGSRAVGDYAAFPGSAVRAAAYEEMWRREESELWTWLEDRVGVVGLKEGRMAAGDAKDAKKKQKERERVLGGKHMQARLREEKMVEREMVEQIRVTKERLHALEEIVDKKKAAKKE